MADWNLVRAVSPEASKEYADKCLQTEVPVSGLLLTYKGRAVAILDVQEEVEATDPTRATFIMEAAKDAALVVLKDRSEVHIRLYQPEQAQPE